MGYIITANLAKGRKVTTEPVFRWNHGMTLRFINASLPDTYRVDFSNSMNGMAKSQIGTAENGVTIPDEYFMPGQTIFAWVVLSPTENSAIAEFQISIPVDPKAKATDEKPSQQQESVIDQTINALNAAVDEAQEAISHYPKIVDGYWNVWDVEHGEYVSTGVKAIAEDGVSPVVTVSAITGGHRITITDADGEHAFDVLDGINGNDGRGIVSIQKTGTSGLTDTYTITYTDGTTQTYSVVNGEDGISPTIAVSSIAGGHRITVTDENGTRTFDVMDGTDGTDGTDGKGIVSIEKTSTSGLEDTYTITYTTGAPTTFIVTNGQDGAPGRDGTDGTNGRDGTDGTDGTTFTPAVSSEGVISWTNDGNKQNPSPVNIKGPAGTDGQNGQNGTDGVSPVVTITNITGGHQVTITDTDHPGGQTFDVMDGTDGQTGQTGPAGPGVASGGAQGQMLVKKSGTDYDTEWANQPTVPVQDVQVNGSSILNNGVANVPVADNGVFGVIKFLSGYGIKSVSNAFAIDSAGDGLIKLSADDYRPIVPSKQHVSTFYGLAKAAGDTTQSASSNAVGTYTEDAKSKISEMLDAPETVSGSTPSITAKAGVRYICGECATLDIATPASGIIDIVFQSGSTPTVLTVTPPTGTTMKWANGFDPTSLDANTTYEINIMDGVYGVVGAWT